ncbi:MAG: hypothetical protein ACKOVB_22685 [Terrabacter sp.]
MEGPREAFGGDQLHRRLRSSCCRRPEGLGSASTCQGARSRRARLARPDPYAVRLAELELLSAARLADLLAPGQVLLRLAVAGFGVTLPPTAGGRERTA